MFDRKIFVNCWVDDFDDYYFDLFFSFHTTEKQF